MGTNYYFKPFNVGYGSIASIHIGKSSCGWKFVFHSTEEFKTSEDWFKVLKSGVIRSEYNEILSFSVFREMINAKRFEQSYGDVEFFCHKYYNDRKYDYLEGEFC